jgi:hypothetical protein
MTTFAEMEALVVAQTRRPEIPAVTRAAIKSATLRAHHVDFFPRDLASAPLTYAVGNGAGYYDIANLSTIISRLRAPTFIHCIEPATFRPIEKLDYRDADDVYDSAGNGRLSAYTLIGDTLRIYPQLATGRLELFYYKNPDTSTVLYESWIATTYPEEVAMWAAGIVFARTGFAEMAAEFKKDHVNPFREMLVSSHLLGNVA